MTRGGRRDQRGNATLLVTVAVLVVVGIAALLLVGGVARATGERVRGAADLAALAGARAQADNADACAAARSSARGNGAEVVACRVSGDEVEFVVTVSVRLPVGFGPVREALTARANAGVVTGADP